MRVLFPELSECVKHKYRNYYCSVTFLLVRARVCYCYWSAASVAVKPKLVSEGTPRARKTRTAAAAVVAA